MALTCVDGGKECTGCMGCCEDSKPMYCPMCHTPLGRQDRVFLLPNGEMGCESCVVMMTAEEVDWLD